MGEYNEAQELLRYTWQFLTPLMKEEERVVWNEWHASRYDAFAPSKARLIRGLADRYASPEIARAREMGIMAYTWQILERLDTERPDGYYIHRCNECSCILFTPEAQQCFWCGADWHPPSPS